jgi:P pilus assembly chaperone PapD
VKSLILWLVFLPFTGYAINVGTMTFAMDKDQQFVAKQVINNNSGARIYQVSIDAINRPGEKEQRSRPSDGEILFSPKTLVLQGGKAEYYKFFYHGPKDDRERYYRVLFREMTPGHYESKRSNQHAVNVDPVIVMDTILVVRPRKLHFAYQLNPQAGSIKNTGNTYFKFLLKSGCNSSDEEGITQYLRPGDTFTHPGIKQSGQKFIIYNEKFISVDKSCIE